MLRSIAFLSSVLANVPGMNPTALELFAQYGPVVLILGFVLVRLEPRLRSIEYAIAENSRVQLIWLMELKSVSDEAKRQASVIIKDIDARRKLKSE
jgi:hypothetical protein